MHIAYVFLKYLRHTTDSNEVQELYKLSKEFEPDPETVRRIEEMMESL
jgi:hypothetical protein